jgi:ABC-type uncharacterized transport system permease subunit
MWRSFYIGASGGLYIGGYAIYFMLFEAKMNFVMGELVYLIYAVLATLSFVMLCGCVAVFASAMFVHSIYSEIRSE